MNRTAIIAETTPTRNTPTWIADMGFDTNTIPADAFLAHDLDCWEPAPPPRPADTARVERLIAALHAGVRITCSWGHHYTVASGSQSGKTYEVTCWPDSDGNRHTTCTCEHGKRWGAVVRYNRGTAQAHTIGRVCRHMIVVHFARLSEPSRAALLAQWPELAAALAPSPLRAGKAA